MIKGQIVEVTDNGLKIQVADERSMKVLIDASICWTLGGVKSVDIDPENKMVLVVEGRVEGYESVIKHLGVRFDQ